MPTFTLPGVDRRIWVDTSGRVQVIKFPCTTDDKHLIAELKALGAIERPHVARHVSEPTTSDEGES